ncbi:OprO/OprP family phosphate-selective porin [Allosphingosinicella vermicomposti]|uniref:OprO/OprP family phosphate-selective porin n=1 Tax=Allosphingosinicella vermicomposti TaxID=614671 RepID=UPI00131A4C9D|nr:porin [Allosphingosinicella vermicomposti]
MMTKPFVAALLSATFLSSAAQAQDPDLAAELAAMRAKIESLEAEVTALKAQKPETPSWKGAPQFEDKEAGFSFKPKGFVQFDTGYVENPGDAVATQNLGYNSRARRLVFGAEGTLPGGFGYKAEFNFAGGSVDYEDIVLTYQPKGSPLQITLGNFYPLSSLETMTSSRLTSFLERSQAVDAFGFNRRIGAAIGLVDPNDRYTLTAGIFNAPIGSAFNNDSWQASVRGTYSPKIGDNGRLHLGANYQHRETQSDAQSVRYRTRPFTQLTDVRFVDTGAIAAKGEDIIGVELGGIFGPLHFAAEGQKVWANAYAPGTTFEGLDGVGGGVFYNGDPSFMSAYAEIGYYLTGETRGYKGGKWDRTKVLRPVGKGGIGAVQINARVDYVDLTDRLSGESLYAPDHINGGSQTGYQLSAIWNPIDYVRFLLQYSHADVKGGPLAATVKPDSSEPVDERSYGVDSIGLRAQVEF